MLLQKLRQHWKVRRATSGARPDRGLQVLLWAMVSSAVAARAYVQWHADTLAHRQLDLLALCIHCVTVGLVGLVVITWIEIRLAPWRFIDK